MKVRHRAPCPDCGRLAIKLALRSDGLVLRAHYVCERGHEWETRWALRKETI